MNKMDLDMTPHGLADEEKPRSGFATGAQAHRCRSQRPRW